MGNNLCAVTLVAVSANAALRSDGANVYYCPLDSCLGLAQRDAFMVGPQAGMYDCFDVNTGQPIEATPATWNAHYDPEYPGEREMDGLLVEPFDYAASVEAGTVPPTYDGWWLATDCCNEITIAEQCTDVVIIDSGDRSSQCPDPKKGNFGICWHECSIDGDCEEGKICCSNGCGHTCQKPKSKCPYVKPGTIGHGAMMCSSDEDCSEGEACCSNGFGKDCVAIDQDICDICISDGRVFSGDQCLSSCDLAPSDVSCYTDADGCEERRELLEVEKLCEAAASTGCENCIDAHESCVFDSSNGRCYASELLWFLPTGVVDDCSMLPTCETDEDCSGDHDPCADAVCTGGECQLVYIACMYLPEICENTGEYKLFDPLTCCGFLPCEAEDVCHVEDAGESDMYAACAARGQALGEKCEVRGRNPPQCRLPRCSDVWDHAKCEDREDCYLRENNNGRLRCRNLE